MASILRRDPFGRCFVDEREVTPDEWDREYRVMFPPQPPKLQRMPYVEKASSAVFSPGAPLTEETIKRVLADLEQMLRKNGQPTESAYEIGIHYTPGEHGWQAANPNGSATFVVKWAGGAHDTRD